MNSVSMHPPVEFQIMVAVLKHPEKMLAEIAHDVSKKKSVYFGRPFFLHEEKPFQSEKGKS